MPCRFTFLHIFQFGVWIWSSGFALDLRSDCQHPHRPRSNRAAEDNAVAFCVATIFFRIATKTGRLRLFSPWKRIPQSLRKGGWTASYGKQVMPWGFFGFRPTFSCHSHFTPCPGLLGDFSVDTYSARTKEFSMLRIVPLSLLFRYRQFLSIPLPGCPLRARLGKKRTRLSNVQFIVGG